MGAGVEIASCCDIRLGAVSSRYGAPIARLGFPMAYGADASRIAAATGAFLNESPKYLQSTGFVLDPAGTVRLAVYSSGAIGRLVPEDVVGLVRHIRSVAA